MGSVPCITGTRIPVATVVSLVAEGSSEQAIVEAYPQLTADDVREALRYAAEAVRERRAPASSRCVKFLVDECLTRDVAERLAAAGLDAVHVSDIVWGIPGCRPLDAGELSNATAIEAFTAVLLQLNVRYKTRVAPKLTGITLAPPVERSIL